MEENRPKTIEIGLRKFILKKQFLIIFLLIPSVINSFGGIIAAFLSEEGIYLTTENGINAIETNILLFGYISCAILAYIASRVFNSNREYFIITRARTIIISTGITFLISYLFGYVVGSFTKRGMDPLYDADNPIYSMTADTIFYLSGSILLTWIMGGFLLIHFIFSHYYQFPEQSKEAAEISMDSTFSLPVSSRKRFGNIIPQKLNGFIQSEKGKNFFLIYFLASIGIFLYTFSPNEQGTDYSLSVKIISSFLLPIIFFIIFTGTLFVSVEILSFCVSKLVTRIFPNQSILKMLISSTSKKAISNKDIEIEFQENRSIFLKSHEFLFWFGIFLYSLGLSVYSVITVMNIAENQLELILTVIVVVFLFILPFIIPLLEAHILLYSMGLFLKNNRTGELKRVGWVRILSKSDFLKLGGLITSFFYILTNVTDDLIDLIFINIDQAGFMLLFIALILFAGWLVYWKYERGYDKKISLLKTLLRTEDILIE